MIETILGLQHHNLLPLPVMDLGELGDAIFEAAAQVLHLKFESKVGVDFWPTEQE